MRIALLLLFLLGASFVARAQAGYAQFPKVNDRGMFNYRLVLISGTEAYITEQVEAFREDWQAVTERHLRVFVNAAQPYEVLANSTQPLADDDNYWASRYKLVQGHNTCLLVGKDITVKSRQTTVVNPADFFAAIDTMPFRRREMSGY